MLEDYAKFAVWFLDGIIKFLTVLFVIGVFVALTWVSATLHPAIGIAMGFFSFFCLLGFWGHWYLWKNEK